MPTNSAAPKAGAKILVTGGAGFIGSHIVDQLVDLDFEVTVIDCLDPAAHSTKPPWLNRGATYVWADVAERDALRRAAEGSEAICHQAAKVGLGVDISDMPAYVHQNDVATAVLLSELAAQRFVGRIAIASSMVVYGEGGYSCTNLRCRAGQGHDVRPPARDVADLDAGDFEPHCPACGEFLIPKLIDEDAALDPRNTYAATKLHQEHLASVFARETGIAVTALRYHNVYGPRMPQNTPYAGVASIFRSSIERGEPPKVFEDGGQRRDFVHVTDVAAANVIALTGPEPHAGAFNVASGQPITLLDMANTLCATAGKGFGADVVGGYRLGDVRHITASIDRARSVLGYDPRVSPASGLARFVTDPLRAPPAAAPQSASARLTAPVPGCAGSRQ